MIGNLMWMPHHHHYGVSGFLPVSPFWYNVFEWCMGIMMIILVIACILAVVAAIKCVYDFSKIS